jgi:hypothetical protein
VSYKVLKVFFPLDSVALEDMAKEQKRVKMLSGVASQTDIAAGEVIANYVADKLIARSKTDGMGTAGGNPTLWPSWKVMRNCMAHRDLEEPGKSSSPSYAAFLRKRETLEFHRNTAGFNATSTSACGWLARIHHRIKRNS